MKTTLMQRMATGVTVSAVLAIGHPAAAAERAAATAEPRLMVEGVALAGVLHTDPRDAHAAAELLARAGGAEEIARSTKTGGGRGRKARRGAVIGGAVGGALGFFVGYGGCHNEVGRNCPLSMRFAGLGALAGAGIGAALGAIGLKFRPPSPWPQRSAKQ